MPMVRNLLPPKPEEKKKPSPRERDGRLLPDPGTIFPKGKEDGLPPEMPEIPENPRRQPPDKDDDR